MRATARRVRHNEVRGGRGPSRSRRALSIAAGVSLLGTLVIAAPAGAQDEVEPGKGNAYAQGIKVDPALGQLSFGITYGQALAGHQNSQAIAEARSIDLGVLGTTLAGEGCDGGDPTLPAENQPQPLVSRTDEGDGGPKSLWELTVERKVDSTSQPYATSTAVAAGAGQPGVAMIGATVSTAESGVIDGRRVARATTDVASVGIPGVLEITGLHWEVEYQTAPTESTVTEFTIDGIRVANTSLVGTLLDLIPGDLDLPLVNFKNPLQSLEAINELLTPLGISIIAPKSYVESGIAFVDPLRINIAPRNTTIGALVELIQPVREAITGSLIAMDCGNATYVTVADLALGSVTGAGSLGLELGGVTATTGEVDVFEFEFDDLPEAVVPPQPTTPPSTLGPIGTSAPTPTFGSTPTTVGGDIPEEQEVAAPAEPVASTSPLGVRGGAMLGVGLGVLALLAGLAEGDRRKMRKAQRSVPMITPMSGPGGDTNS